MRPYVQKIGEFTFLYVKTAIKANVLFLAPFYAQVVLRCKMYAIVIGMDIIY